MLNAYIAATQNLLQNPGAPTTLYSTANLTTYINTARGQLAGDAQCIRVVASLALTINVPNYLFSAITVSGTSGVSAVLNVRQISCSASTPPILNPWPWEYFYQYFVATGLASGQPSDWAQYGPGTLGSFYLSPSPNSTPTIFLDTVCTPINLVDDTTPEAIPYPWTDAVPYFAAYLALMSAQTTTRTEYAMRMLQLYNEFKDRARRYSTPDVLPLQYEQTPSRLLINQGAQPQQQRAQ